MNMLISRWTCLFPEYL